ncbi:MAG: hypothetical protein K2F53_00050 [Rikenellaceae bacterium]|nr:hypothetical protein [Rikenellaceae bacterium]MDE7356248.1 hypothetical protein [Rikenellaceae bacterium]
MEFPAVGYRYDASSGKLYNAGQNGYYWSSVASDSNNAYSLYFGSGYLGVSTSNNKQTGRSVRCVR